MAKTNYQNDDQLGREIFKSYCKQQKWCKVNKESKNDYAPWDISYYSGTTQIIGEIKVREYSSDSFPTWILELDKLQALRELQAKQPSTKITYINHFPDNITLIWDLTNLDETQLYQGVVHLPKNNYTTETRLKSVVYLPKYMAIVKDETDSNKSIFN